MYTAFLILLARHLRQGGNEDSVALILNLQRYRLSSDGELCRSKANLSCSHWIIRGAQV